MITIGRYLLHREIARGGMATVHLARLIGDEGFTRIVAAKRLHPQLAEDQGFIAMFLAEARIASKLRHPNIVPVLDVVTADGQVVLVQEYVHGAPLQWLLDEARVEGRRVPIDIAVAIACQVLAGLHAAHVLTDEVGQPLNVVHRDVSPHNVMIATDGTARLLDFGVAKTSSATQATAAGVYKGKIAYSAPEQLRGAAIPQSDVYSLAVMLWELLVGERMYELKSESELVIAVLNGQRPHMRETLWKKASSIPSGLWAQLEQLEPIVERGLASSLADRWNTAEELDLALRGVVTPAPASAVAQWLKVHGRDYLEQHERAISDEESSWRARPTRRAVGSTPPSSTMQPEHSALRLLPRVGSRAPRASLQVMPSTNLPSNAPAEVARGHAPARQQGDAPAQAKNWRRHGSALHAALPSLPEWSGHGAVIAVLGALIVAALLGIVLVVRSSSQSAAAPSLVPASQPVQSFISRPGPRPPAPPPQRVGRSAASRETPAPATSSPRAQQLASPVAPATETPAAKVASPLPTKIVREPAPAKPASRPPVRAPVTRTVTKPRSEAAPTPTKTEAKPAAEPIDCTPPYYFVGAKKHFKPACL